MRLDGGKCYRAKENTREPCQLRSLAFAMVPGNIFVVRRLKAFFVRRLWPQVKFNPS